MLYASPLPPHLPSFPTRRSSDLSGVEPKPPVLWVRGADDVIVSDTSLYDLAYLGSLGAIPGWPGEQTWPPQPMVADRKSTRLNSSHVEISYAVFCLKKIRVNM